MDEIVEAVKEFAKAGVDNAAAILLIAVKIVILLTAPAWILPYAFLRDMQRNNDGGCCENPECDSCPFPPCEKGEIGND